MHAIDRSILTRSHPPTSSLAVLSFLSWSSNLSSLRRSTVVVEVLFVEVVDRLSIETRVDLVDRRAVLTDLTL